MNKPLLPTNGMSTFDLLGDIPREERILIQVFLRNSTKLTKKQLTQLVAELPEKKRLSPSELNATLKELIKKGWVRKRWRNYIFQQQKHQGKKT